MKNLFRVLVIVGIATGAFFLKGFFSVGTSASPLPTPAASVNTEYLPTFIPIEERFPDPTPLPTATQEPTPSPNWQATITVLQSSQDSTQLEIERVKLEQKKADAEAERERNHQAELAYSAKIKIEQEENRHLELEIELVKANEAADLAKARVIVAENESKRIGLDERKLEQEEGNAVLRTVFVALLFAVLVVLAYLVFRQKASPVHVRPDIVVYSRGKDGENRRSVFPEIENVASFLAWAASVTTGATIAVDYWEKAGRYRGEYRPLHRWLYKHGYVAKNQNNEAVLTQEGSNKILDICSELTTSPLPLRDVAPESVPPAAVNTETVRGNGQNPEGEGDGWIWPDEDESEEE